MGYHLTARTSAAANANEGGQEKKVIHLSITENLSALHRDQAILVRSPGGSPFQKQPGQPLLQNQSAISTPPPCSQHSGNLDQNSAKPKKGKFFNVVSHLWPFMANSHGGGKHHMGMRLDTTSTTVRWNVSQNGEAGMCHFWCTSISAFLISEISTSQFNHNSNILIDVKMGSSFPNNWLSVAVKPFCVSNLDPP